MLVLAMQAVVAFNLVCTAMQSQGRLEPSAPDGFRVERERSVTDVYRVDLQNMRWCVAECTRTNQIASVSGTEIILDETRHVATGVITTVSVNRETGAYIFSMHLGRLVDLRIGTCERAAFSGMPTLRF